MLVLGMYDVIIYLLCGIVTVLTITQILTIVYLGKKKGKK